MPTIDDPTIPVTPKAGDGFRIAGRDEPDARRAENRGRLWLVLSYVLCPCHLPVTMAIVAGVAGGTAVGAVLTANAWRFGAGLTLVYAAVLWRAFHHLRRARALSVDGALVCGPTGCEVVPADEAGRDRGRALPSDGRAPGGAEHETG